MHGRSRENGLRFETPGRNVMLTWSQLILRTPVTVAVTAAVDFRSRNWRRDNQTGTNFNTLQRLMSFGAKRGIKLGNRRNVYG